eukprot:m.783791 g.783791  ORF g.783791 m.783791 type:complete len:252 (+) comp59155_c0_seq3:1968-2723(+)
MSLLPFLFSRFLLPSWSRRSVSCRSLHSWHLQRSRRRIPHFPAWKDPSYNDQLLSRSLSMAAPRHPACATVPEVWTFEKFCSLIIQAAHLRQGSFVRLAFFIFRFWLGFQQSPAFCDMKGFFLSIGVSEDPVNPPLWTMGMPLRSASRWLANDEGFRLRLVVYVQTAAKQGLRELLRAIGLPDCIRIFEAQEIDMDTFLTLTESDLAEIGIEEEGVRGRISSAILALRRKKVCGDRMMSFCADLRGRTSGV